MEKTGVFYSFVCCSLLTFIIMSSREHIYPAAILLQWPGWDGAHCVTGKIRLENYSCHETATRFSEHCFIQKQSSNVIFTLECVFIFLPSSTSMYFLSLSGVWHNPGKVWPSVWRCHCHGANEAERTQTAHSSDHEPAGQTGIFLIKKTNSCSPASDSKCIIVEDVWF